MKLSQLLLQITSIRALSSNKESLKRPVYSLQSPHPEESPAEVFESLAKACREQGLEWDDYGDYDKTAETSFLRNFESELATLLKKEDAVIMPSGVMAQSIALLIHSNERKNRRFACHASSHLLLHENDGYKELLGMELISIETHTPPASLHTPAMRFSHVQEALNKDDQDVATLILELPHRELGGKCTPYEDILKMEDLCHARNIAFHCDGARLFEATAGYNQTLATLAQPFDSVYLSFYKGLGGVSGAVLLGKKEFCDQARIWLRRFGGNLYTLLPYALSGWIGYDRNWKQPHMSFSDKREKLVHLVDMISSDEQVSAIVSFDPLRPEVNMVHGYLRASTDECASALDKVQEQSGIRVLKRIRTVLETERAFDLGFLSRFEWSIGTYNCNIPNGVFLDGWRQFSSEFR